MYRIAGSLLLVLMLPQNVSAQKQMQHVQS
jgi:hypothetical protein